MVEVKRKKGETFESMLRRFTRHIVNSDTMDTVKEKRFRIKEISRNAQKENKVERLKRSVKIEYMKKVGKIDENHFRKRKRRF